MPIKNKRKLSFFVLIIFLTISLFACSDEEHMQDLHRYIDGVKKAITKHTRRNIIADIEFPTPVSFQPADKQRDPFEDEQASFGGEELNNPLIAFPVKSFEFAGTVVRNNETWAIIKAPDNKIYQVTIKDRIGNHYGRIVEISSDHIKVEEEISAQEAGATGQGAMRRIETLQLKGGE